jgi:glycosyltransferase involved in cell wall biosynthesis
VFLSPDGYLSLRSDIPQVAVIHDLNFEHFPHFFDPFHRWHYRTFFPRYCQKAKKIATVSEFSRKDISVLYNIPLEKIDVIYNGVDTLYQPADKASVDEFKKNITGGQDYFVFIGGLYLRKNLSTILKAFDAFKKKTHLPVKFILAGKSYKETKELFELHRTLECKEDIIFLGRVEPREQIPVILSGALSLVYVSLFEGFGLPIAEAMQCGTPVITGNITAMPEIAGDAAILADPYSYQSIAAAMEQIATSDKLRAELRQKGFEQAKKFTWKNTADKLWKTLQASVNY